MHEDANNWDGDTPANALPAVACTNVLHYAFTTFTSTPPEERDAIQRHGSRLAWV
jgi:hypothetical protein